MTDRAISVMGAEKRYGRVEALRKGFSIQVDRGCSLAVLGANGAGKTTLMRIILGLAIPGSGTVLMNGRPPDDPESRAGVRFLPERITFPGWATPLEMYRQFERVRREGTVSDFIHRAESLGSGDLLERKLGKMSKGQRQRIAVALMTCGNPGIVFLDEPSSGLDPAGRMLVRNAVSELVGNGTTVVLNSHLLGEVEQVCDRAAFIHRGSLLAHERLDVLSRFKGSAVVETGEPENLSRLMPDGTVHGRTVVFPLKSEEDFPALVGRLASSGAGFSSVKLQKETLEDIFMRIMEEDNVPERT
jgi:ABC-2 type transport system ATP-binding protein